MNIWHRERENKTDDTLLGERGTQGARPALEREQVVHEGRCGLDLNHLLAGIDKEPGGNT